MFTRVRAGIQAGTAKERRERERDSEREEGTGLNVL